MSILPKSLSRLIESFEALPGIGNKTAQRLGFYLLHVPEDQLVRFADALTALKKNTKLCSSCRNVTETDPCSICSNPSRNHGIVCVVEQPTDVLSIEKTGKFPGVYHVLHGVIDPLNNIGPDEIYLTDLVARVTSKGTDIAEVILAMNPNMEGEATAMYILRQLKDAGSTVNVTRLAHGLPVGADIEYADEITLTRALEGRISY